jgi:hypothetical protein
LKRFLLPILLFAVSTSFAQSLLDAPVRIKEDKPAIAFFEELEKTSRVRFYFLEDWIRFSTVYSKDDGKKLKDVLDALMIESDLKYSLLFDYAIIFTRDPSIAIQRENLLYRAAASRKDIQTVTLGSREKDYRPGKRIIVSGKIKSEVNDEVIGNSIVYVNNLNLTFNSDATGNYSLNLPAGEHVITFQSQNFSDKVIDLRAYANGKLDIILEEAPTILQEVEVSDQAIVTGRAGQSSLLIKNLKRGPTFLGESDVIKNLQIQPGVTSVGEVSAGFNVRGGGTDQNLVLYDGIPIFNTSHALGFFSGFNPEAIGNVTFYRGGIPAEFGSRVSSVLNITSREGDYKKWSASGGIGIISSNVTVGGPIKRDTTSVIASFRSSYSNWLLRKVKSNYADIGESSLAFMDGSLKLAHKLNSRTKIQLSGYASQDEFSLANDTLYQWQNLSGSLRIDHTHSERLFSTVTLGFGRYGYNFRDDDPENAFKMQYGITYPSLNIDLNRNGDHSLSFGVHNTFYNFKPGLIKPTSSESTQGEIKMRDENSLETALYISDGFYWKENLYAEFGLRYSLYNRLGAGTVYNYTPGSAIEPRNTMDSTNYGAGEIMKTYHGPEPRVSLRYTLTPTASVKLGYNRIYQYMHLITNTAAITPVDIWQSSNTYFKPQIADQISLGYYRTFHDNMFEGFVEAYYKNIQNVLDFKDGASLIMNRKIETALLPGKAIAYGVEVSGSKVKGRLQGMVNYTYSRSLRKVDGLRENEKINSGEYYASNSDQPHVTNLNFRYGVSRRHFFSGNFTYHTGRPMSAPRDGYIIDNNVISDFSERNKFRIPDYHRLDLAFIIEGNHKRKKLWDGTWTISFYNIYARKNAYSVFYDEDPVTKKLEPYKLTVIGTVIPSLSYGFKL